MSGQELFNVRLLADVKSLDRGVLGYQAPSSIAISSYDTLSVQVIDIGRGENGTKPLPGNTGFTLAPQDVPTGGLVGVRASCQGVNCEAISPERQPVTSGLNGNWEWQLSGQSPGAARVLLVATTYDQGTNIPLHVTGPIEITITVTATPGYWVSRAGHWTVFLIGLIGFGTIITGMQWSWRHRRKAKKRAVPPDPKTPAAPSSG